MLCLPQDTADPRELRHLSGSALVSAGGAMGTGRSVWRRRWGLPSAGCLSVCARAVVPW